MTLVHNLVAIVALAIMAPIGPAYALNKGNQKNSVIAQNYCYQTCKVSLVGVLKFEPGYGPPGYGETPETDRKITNYILLLDQPINVAGNDLFLAQRNVKEVQLSFPYGSSLHFHNNERIIANGNLQGPVTATAVREVIMSVIRSKSFENH